MQHICWTQAVQTYVTKNVVCPQFDNVFSKADDYSPDVYLCARYTDDKSSIALCGYFDGKMYVTIPSENKNRQIEVVWIDEISFTDDYGYCADYFMFRQLEALFIRGIINPTEDGSINPFKKITRAEACRMFASFMGCTSKDDLSEEFIDVSKEHEDYLAIANLCKLGIVQGTGNGLFEPDRIITREELVVMTARLAAFLEFNLSISDATGIADLISKDSVFNEEYFQKRY